MNALVLVSVGGAAGAVARFAPSSALGRLVATPFPIATLAINILGSVAMGIFVGLMARLLPAWQEEARLFVAVGLLGGFTTFSTFSLDTIVLLQRGELAQALFYVGLSVVVCVAGLYLGLLISRGSVT